MENNDYIESGDIITTGEHFAVQLDRNWGGGTSFRTLKYATYYSDIYILGLQESNVEKDLISWKKVTLAELVLIADKKIVQDLQAIQSLVRLGYKGLHSHNEHQLAEIEWRMYGYR